MRKNEKQSYINSMNQKYINNKGITLLVLAITIIVMLILAGVTIHISTNEDGIIKKTTSSIAKLEVSEEKDVLAVSYSALLLKEELYDAEMTAQALQDKIAKNGKEALVTLHEDEKGILVVKFRKTGNVYWIKIEDGEVDYKGTNTEKWDETVIQKEDIIFTSEPSSWTNGDVNTTITVKDGVNMSDFVLQWTKTPENKKSWQEYTDATKIISEKNEKITARIREKNTDRTRATNEENINNIDKQAPIGTLAVENISTNTAVLKVTATDEATEDYGASGIKGFYYSKDDGATWSEMSTESKYTFTKLTQTKQYKFKVKIEDKVGNTKIVGTEETTGTVPTPTDADLKYTTTWSGTDATVTFTTTKEGFWIQTSIDGTHWNDTNPITVPSGTQIYVRYSDSEITEEGANQGPKYAAVRPLWTGTVSYNANGGIGGPSSQNVQHTKTVNVSFTNLPTRTGYTFQGWNTKADATGTNYTQSGTKTFTMGTENITLYAVWQSVQIPTTFATTNPTCSASISSNKQTLGLNVSSGSIVATFSLAPRATVKTEITSSSYEQGDSGARTSLYVNEREESSLQTRGTLTYTNVGTENVTIKVNVGAGYMIDQTTVTFADGVKGEFVSETYTVTYNANGGTGGKTSETVYKGLYVWTPGPTRTGYTLQGWATASSATSASISQGNPFKPTSDTTLYAVWVGNTYKLTVNMNGGKCNYHVNGTSEKASSESFDLKFTYGTRKHFADTLYTDTSNNFVQTEHFIQNGHRVPRRDGYTFTGFKVTTGSGTISTVRGPVEYGYTYDSFWYDASYAGDVIITAQWKVNTYTVTYNGNGNTGGSTANSSHTYGTAKALTANGYTKTGYTFQGWNTKSDGTGTSYTNQQSVTNLTTTNGGTVTLYAKWKANTYKIYFSANGGSGAPSAIDRTYGQAVTFPSTKPTKTGYTFVGWLYYSIGNSSSTATSTATSGGYAAGATAQPASGNICYTANHTTYVAVWKANNYTVTYNYSTNGGSSATKTSATVACGSAIDLSPTATKAGWTFVGWNTSSTATTGLTSKSMGSSNVTLYAIYKKTISANWYYYNGSSYTNSATSVTIYNTATSGTPAKPTVGNPSGWSGRGWSTSTSSNATTATPGAISSNTTYYYSWSKTVTISYNANGGTGAPSAQTGTAYLNYVGTVAGASITISSTKPTKSKCVFQGWEPESQVKTYSAGTAYTFNASQTLYAKWKEDVTAPTISVSQTLSTDKKTATLRIKTTDSETGVKQVKYAIGDKNLNYFKTGGTSIATDRTMSSISSDSYFSALYQNNYIEKDLSVPYYYTFYAIDNAGNERVQRYTLTGLKFEITFTGKNGLSITEGGGSIASNGAITINNGVAGATQYGPYVTLPIGTYEVDWYGHFPYDYYIYDVATSLGTVQIEQDRGEYENFVGITFKITAKTQLLEFRLLNSTPGSVTDRPRVDKIVLTKK